MAAVLFLYGLAGLGTRWSSKQNSSENKPKKLSAWRSQSLTSRWRRISPSWPRPIAVKRKCSNPNENQRSDGRADLRLMPKRSNVRILRTGNPEIIGVPFGAAVRVEARNLLQI